MLATCAYARCLGILRRRARRLEARSVIPEECLISEGDLENENSGLLEGLGRVEVFVEDACE